MTKREKLHLTETKRKRVDKSFDIMLQMLIEVWPTMESCFKNIILSTIEVARSRQIKRTQRFKRKSAMN